MVWRNADLDDYLDGNPCLKNGFDEFTSLTLKDPLVHSNLPKLQI